jgi:hypothetical protein
VRTWLNSRAWPCQCINGWDMARAVFVVADGLTAHESAFANLASARAPVFGSISRRHSYLSLNVEIFTEMMSFRFKRRMPEIIGQCRRSSDI